MRLAVDTIEYDQSVERAMSYACGNAMVCDDLATAKYLCYEKHIEAKAVTLDGTIIHKGGLMTGGRGPNDRARKWEDSDVDNLRKMKDKLMSEIAALPKGHKAVTDEEALRGELTGLEERLVYASDEVEALGKNLESKKKELSHIQNQLAEGRPRYEEQSEALQNLQERIEEFKHEVSEVEDEVFASFCERLHYDNIRAYESQQGSLQQEGAQKKLEFTMQRSRLENQLSFETQRLQSTKDRIRTLESQGQRDRDLIKSLEAEKEAIQGELHQVEEQLAHIKSKLDQLKTKYSEKVDKVAEQRREVQKRTKDVDFIVKTVTGLEADLQRSAGGRYALLRKCKIDEVKLPLTKDSASLEVLPVDNLLQEQQTDPDAMDVDGDIDASQLQTTDINDYGIEIDFDELDDDLKDVRMVSSGRVPH